MKQIWKSIFVGLCAFGLLAACNTKPQTSNTDNNSSETPTSSEDSGNPGSSSEDPHDRDPNNPYRVLFLGNSF